MASIECNLNINFVWIKEETKLQQCVFCEETIYSNAYRLYIMPESNKLMLKGHRSKYCICESCNDLINNSK